MVVRDDAFDDVEPESRTLPRCLRGEVWLEDPLGERRRNTGAGVSDFNTKGVAVHGGSNADGPLALCLSDGIGGIVQEVCPELMELGAVRLHARQLTIVLADNLCLCLAQLVTHQRQAALDRLMDVDDATTRVGVGLALHRVHQLTDARRAARHVVEQLAYER